MSDVRYADHVREKKRSGWKTALIVILIICALPVLIPVVFGAGAVAAGILLALAGCGLAVILGAGGCVIAGIVGLAILLFCGVVGSGYGLVMLFSTPASGLAVTGTSLMMAGAGILGCLIVWQIGRFLVWVVRKLAGWLHVSLFGGKRNRTTYGAGERQRAEWEKAENPESERVWRQQAEPEMQRAESVKQEQAQPDEMQQESAREEGGYEA